MTQTTPTSHRPPAPEQRQVDPRYTSRSGANHWTARDPERLARVKRNPVRGAAHPKTKLTDEHVRGMRQARREGCPLTYLAAFYGVCPATVRNICTGRTWKHVQDEVSE